MISTLSLAKAFGLSKFQVIELCMHFGVPVVQGMIAEGDALMMVERIESLLIELV